VDYDNGNREGDFMYKWLICMPYVTLKAAEMKFLQSIKKQVRRDII